jgi:hypothetical protein
MASGAYRHSCRWARRRRSSIPAASKADEQRMLPWPSPGFVTKWLHLPTFVGRATLKTNCGRSLLQDTAPWATRHCSLSCLTRYYSWSFAQDAAIVFVFTSLVGQGSRLDNKHQYILAPLSLINSCLDGQYQRFVTSDFNLNICASTVVRHTERTSFLTIYALISISRTPHPQSSVTELSGPPLPSSPPLISGHGIHFGRPASGPHTASAPSFRRVRHCWAR